MYAVAVVAIYNLEWWNTNEFRFVGSLIFTNECSSTGQQSAAGRRGIAGRLNLVQKPLRNLHYGPTLDARLIRRDSADLMCICSSKGPQYMSGVAAALLNSTEYNPRIGLRQTKTPYRIMSAH
jgi:hypothetical protein